MKSAEVLIDKYGLTDNQFYGRRPLSPKDNCVVANCLVIEYGNKSFGVPPVCTAYWGFESWAKWIESHWEK